MPVKCSKIPPVLADYVSPSNFGVELNETSTVRSMHYTLEEDLCKYTRQEFPN